MGQTGKQPACAHGHPVLTGKENKKKERKKKERNREIPFPASRRHRKGICSPAVLDPGAGSGHPRFAHQPSGRGGGERGRLFAGAGGHRARKALSLHGGALGGQVGDLSACLKARTARLSPCPWLSAPAGRLQLPVAFSLPRTGPARVPRCPGQTGPGGGALSTRTAFPGVPIGTPALPRSGLSPKIPRGRVKQPYAELDF